MRIVLDSFDELLKLTAIVNGEEGVNTFLEFKSMLDGNGTEQEREILRKLYEVHDIYRNPLIIEFIKCIDWGKISQKDFSEFVDIFSMSFANQVERAFKPVQSTLNIQNSRILEVVKKETTQCSSNQRISSEIEKPKYRRLDPLPISEIIESEKSFSESKVEKFSEVSEEYRDDLLRFLELWYRWYKGSVVSSSLLVELATTNQLFKGSNVHNQDPKIQARILGTFLKPFRKPVAGCAHIVIAQRKSGYPVQYNLRRIENISVIPPLSNSGSFVEDDIKNMIELYIEAKEPFTVTDISDSEEFEVEIRQLLQSDDRLTYDRNARQFTVV